MSFVTGVTGRVYAGSSMVHLVGGGDGGRFGGWKAAELFLSPGLCQQPPEHHKG